MEPLAVLTAALTSYNITMQLVLKVYEDTPVPIRQAQAENWGRFVLNAGAFFLDIQAQINKAIAPK